MIKFTIIVTPPEDYAPALRQEFSWPTLPRVGDWISLEINDGGKAEPVETVTHYPCDILPKIQVRVRVSTLQQFNSLKTEAGWEEF